MTQQEYEKAKRECWEEFTTISPQYKAFSFAFDRAYNLGKQTETITQAEIEDAAKDYAYDIDGSDWERQRARDGFVDGANFALGKQEKDADTVIQGWVARDANPHRLYIYGCKPLRLSDMWSVLGESFAIQIFPDLFPDLTWDSDPEEVEIAIKRKKN